MKKIILVTLLSFFISSVSYSDSKYFSKKGANLIICARNKKKLDLAKKFLTNLSHYSIVKSYQLDISDYAKVDIFFSKILRKNKIDILINNAGVYGPKGKSEEISWKLWKKTININLLGSIYIINKFIKYFKKQKHGKIIQIAGGGAASFFPFFSPYAVSKAGLVRFVENISKEVENKNIFINAIAPGPINTRMLDEVLQAGPHKVGKDFYYNAIRQKKEGGTDIQKIISLVEYLSHKKSDGISGKLISVLWDNWNTFHNKIDILKNSDVGTLRRVTGRDRKLKFFDCA
jgi:3-oxoacyl-[acyl-carrier protein] reductase